MAYLVPRKTPSKLTPISQRHSSSNVFSMFFHNITPALLTRISSLPNRSTVVRMTSPQSASRVTSCFTKIASPPPLFISSATFLPFTSWVSLIVTFAPSLAIERAMALPMAPPAPVTIATLPRTRFITSSYRRFEKIEFESFGPKRVGRLQKT